MSQKHSRIVSPAAVINSIWKDKWISKLEESRKMNNITEIKVIFTKRRLRKPVVGRHKIHTNRIIVYLRYLKRMAKHEFPLLNSEEGIEKQLIETVNTEVICLIAKGNGFECSRYEWYGCVPSNIFRYNIVAELLKSS
jgi:hypothetical protein